MDVWTANRTIDPSGGPSITVSWVWPVALVIVVGEVDGASAPLLERRLVEAVERRAARIVVDASALTFLDSAAVDVLVAASQLLRCRGGTLTLVDLRPDLRRVVESTAPSGEVLLVPASR